MGEILWRGNASTERRLCRNVFEEEILVKDKILWIEIYYVGKIFRIGICSENFHQENN